jgi:SM-20-related protein
MTPLPLPHKIIRGYLAADAHAAALAWALASGAGFEPAKLEGGLVDPEVRRASSTRDLGPIAAALREKLLAQTAELTHELRLTPFTIAEIELELVAYGDQACFVRHTDTYTGTASARGDRMLSAVYYFHREPKGFGGGALRLHHFGPETAQGAHVDIEAEQNSLVVFPSWGPHEVLPVRVPSGDFADSRFAVNAWVYRASPLSPRR